MQKIQSKHCYKYLDCWFDNNWIINRIINKLKIFKLGNTWGGFDSLITFPPLDKREFKNRNTGTLIRLYCGLEDIDDQIKDIKNALKILN